MLVLLNKILGLRIIGLILLSNISVVVGLSQVVKTDSLGCFYDIVNYSDSIETGTVIFHNSNHSLKGIFEYKSRKKDGQSIDFFENGQVKKICHYNNGKLWGMFLTFYKNGAIQTLGNYGEGVGVKYVNSENNFLKPEDCSKDTITTLIGEWRIFYPDGGIKVKGKYSGNYMVVIEEHMDAGSIVFSRNIVNEQIGEWVYFNEEGEVAKIRQFFPSSP
ncbi:toxin-antitoxin system YwqK family antitoxin [Saccharicrinis aurantiacus]|uniref:toxin-antitoxin system YwqK family antitoxin n=1 Tax=Saccharicrinis aurantiacus TaxID=1849719 RepID=UPI00094FDBE5|nr:hypothetical protein [Saccharicrinis aurantiacus]